MNEKKYYTRDQGRSEHTSNGNSYGDKWGHYTRVLKWRENASAFPAFDQHHRLHVLEWCPLPHRRGHRTQ